MRHRSRISRVSVIKVYFQARYNPDSADNHYFEISPWRKLRRLPPGTLPPGVLKLDARSLPGAWGRSGERNE